MNDKAVVHFISKVKNLDLELEIPTEITANDLILALNSSLGLGMDVENIFNCYLVAENPIACLKGNRKLSEFGVRNATRILHVREMR